MVVWLKNNGITFQKHGTTTRQHYATYKKQRLLQIGFWDERIDFNHVDKHYQGDPQYWIVSWWTSAEIYIGLVDNSEMAAIAWDFGKCGQCKPDKSCIGIVNGEIKGVKKTFFGKDYDGLCKHAGLRIKNPDISAIENIKKLILLSIREVDKKC